MALSDIIINIIIFIIIIFYKVSTPLPPPDCTLLSLPLRSVGQCSAWALKNINDPSGWKSLPFTAPTLQVRLLDVGWRIKDKTQHEVSLHPRLSTIPLRTSPGWRNIQGETPD